MITYNLKSIKKILKKYHDHFLQLLVWGQNLLFIMLAAYLMPIEIFGIFSFNYVIAGVLAVFLKLGLDSVYTYFVNRLDFKTTIFVCLLIFSINLLLVSLVITFLKVFHISIFILALFIALDEIYYSIKRVDGDAKEFLLIRNSLIFLRILAIFFFHQNEIEIIYLLTFSLIPSVLFYSLKMVNRFLTNQNNNFSISIPSRIIKKISVFSFKSTISNLLGVLTVKIDILMLGLLTSFIQVGYYEVGARWGFLAMIPLTLFSAINAPMISKLGQRKSYKFLLIYFNDSRKKVFFITFVYLIFLIILRQTFTIIPHEFSYNPFDISLILAIGFTVSSYFGPTGTAIVMLGYPGSHLTRITISLLINILLNFYFINLYGAYGAALSTCMVLILTALMSYKIFVNITKRNNET